MSSTRIAVSLLAFAALTASALATPSVSGPARATVPPMEFMWVEGHTPIGLTQWIQASGRISHDTPERFQAFAAGRELDGVTVVLDSFGGNIQGGLDLGRAFRQAGVNTTVGRTVLPIPGVSGAPTVITDRIPCNSACAYAFLGGRRRTLAPNAVMALHQFSRPADAGSAVTLAHYQSAQVVLTRIAVYLQEMDVDIRMLQLAAAHAYDGDTAHTLQITEANAYRIGHVLNTAHATSSAVPWALGVRPDQPLLYRRVFGQRSSGRRVDADVALTCGAGDNLMLRARAIHAEAAGPEPLHVSRVEMLVGREPFAADAPSPMPIHRDDSVSYTVNLPRQTLVDAAETAQLTIEITGSGLLQLGAGLAQALPHLLRACDAQRTITAASR